VSAFFDRALNALEVVMFPHQESEEEQEQLTDVGRKRVEGFLREFDEKAFNAGFDAAIKALQIRAGINYVHPQYLRDRAAEYRKARGVR
jgi:hypothetical protein